MWRMLACTAGPRTLTVLYFHRVLHAADPMLPFEPTAQKFARMLSWLASQYRVLPLSEALHRLNTGALSAASAAITFDDGYRDNLEVAAPLLRAAGLPATFFIATGFLDGEVMWNDCVTEAVRSTPGSTLALPELGIHALPVGSELERYNAADMIIRRIKHLPLATRADAVQNVLQVCKPKLPTNLMMTPTEVRALRAQGFEVGAHTRRHPILCQLDSASARAEIEGSRDDLQAILGEPVQLFAYPNGRKGVDFDDSHLEMVREAGFQAALSTDAGVVTSAASRWLLPRFTPWRQSSLGFRLQLLRNQFRRPLGLQEPSTIGTA
jgi:peptidoglycan/xylan/chitin deacetylase (PgdA/CDA1 family)